MEGILYFAIWATCGWACYSIAKSKNRNKELWTVLGVVFGIFAVIAISFLSTIPFG